MAAPIDLNLLRAFATVHETGSFSAAAAKLGVPRSTVSRAVSALENLTGAALFHRTTRRVVTTDDGRALFDRVATQLASLDEALSDLPERREEPSGHLRVTSTVDLGVVVLAEVVTRFSARYPKVTTEVLLSPNVVDLAREKIEVALRVAPKSLPAGPYVARRVGVVSVQLFASPSYLARRGTPRSTSELGDHELVGYDRGSARVISEDMLFVREVLRKHGGIGTLPSFLADEDVVGGHLVRVLPKHEMATARVYLAMPKHKHVPSRVAAFRDLVLEVLRQRPLQTEE
ncbi:MAG TPA: LysR family transcriptional regulator [Polyangiaceae bacterium]|nr:LysR family transcriptional regulator [Polyangiaceae bacterium]